ncbi:MAG TPA: hypothetical protein ENI23_08710 [bacterium]|nr:hypothetical protein [bacterium]
MPLKDPEKRKKYEKERRSRPERILYMQQWLFDNNNDYWKNWYSKNKEWRKVYHKKYFDSWLKTKGGLKEKPVGYYDRVHKWVKRNKGNPSFCVDCKKFGSYSTRSNGAKVWSIQWSNINKKYKMKLNDYEGRCIPCHILFDKV